MIREGALSMEECNCCVDYIWINEPDVSLAGFKRWSAAVGRLKKVTMNKDEFAFVLKNCMKSRAERAKRR